MRRYENIMVEKNKLPKVEFGEYFLKILPKLSLDTKIKEDRPAEKGGGVCSPLVYTAFLDMRAGAAPVTELSTSGKGAWSTFHCPA